VTELQRKHGPFAVPPPAYWPNGPHALYTCDASSRTALVKESTDAEWLQAVIRDRDVQASVRLAAERRLRRINK
jgi:hypothetical protein